MIISEGGVVFSLNNTADVTNICNLLQDRSVGCPDVCAMCRLHVMTWILLRHILTAACLQVRCCCVVPASQLGLLEAASSRKGSLDILPLSPPCYKFSSVCIEGAPIPLTAWKYSKTKCCCSAVSFGEWVRGGNAESTRLSSCQNPCRFANGMEAPANRNQIFIPGIEWFLACN